MILLRSHRVMLITLIFIYNSFETRQIGCRYIIRNIRLPYSKSFVQRGGIFPRCLHRGKFRFFNLGYVHERLCRKTYRPLWWRHLSRKWGTKPPSCTQESAISRRRRRTSALSRFIRRSIKYLSAPHAPSPLPPEIRVVFHVRGFDRFPINENAILNTVKRTANATICAAR